MADRADIQDVKVEDYYDNIHQRAWARRTTGFMAGATLGGAHGAFAGVIAAFIPFVLGTAAVPMLPVIAASAGVFFGTGALMGIAAMGLVGSNAASVAAGLEEKERREKISAISQGQALPDAQVKKPEKRPKLYDWKVAVLTIPLFAAFGALLAFGNLAPPAALFSFAAQSPGAIAATAMVFGLFGNVLGFKNSYIGNQISNFYTKMLTGKLLSGENEKTQENKAVAKPAAFISEPQQSIEPKSFSLEAKHFSLQAILEKQEGREATVVSLGR